MFNIGFELTVFHRTVMVEQNNTVLIKYESSGIRATSAKLGVIRIAGAQTVLCKNYFGVGEIVLGVLDSLIHIKKGVDCKNVDVICILVCDKVKCGELNKTPIAPLAPEIDNCDLSAEVLDVYCAAREFLKLCRVADIAYLIALCFRLFAAGNKAEAKAQTKANTALQYTVAVRDKLLEAYQQIMQMQI